MNRTRLGSGPGHARSRDSTRGTAIVPALVVVMIVATLSMIFLQLSLAKNKEQRMSVDAKRAFYMAEAGLAEGFNGLCIGKSGNVGTKDVPAEYSNGLFFVTATENGGGRVTLLSTGMCGAGRATLSMVVERQPDTVASLGFFGNRGISVEAGAKIDSYDSRLGPYLLQAIAIPIGGLMPTGARVGCNSDITVAGTAAAPTLIYGDVRPGPSGTLFRSHNTTISGSMAPSTASQALPDVKTPSVPSRGDLDIPRGNTVLERGAMGFDKLSLAPGASVRIVGPALLVVQELRVHPGATLQLDATKGPIKLFVSQELMMQPGSMFSSQSTDPLAIGVQIGGPSTPSVTIASTGSFHGNIYAPRSDVTIPAGLDVYGAVTAQSLTVKAGGKLHFDRALTQSSSESTGAPKLSGWHIVELPNVPVVSLRYDALQAIRDLGVIPPLSKNANLDIGVDNGRGPH